MLHSTLSGHFSSCTSEKHRIFVPHNEVLERRSPPHEQGDGVQSRFFPATSLVVCKIAGDVVATQFPIVLMRRTTVRALLNPLISTTVVKANIVTKQLTAGLIVMHVRRALTITENG